jgi:hypothetical protein
MKTVHAYLANDKTLHTEKWQAIRANICHLLQGPNTTGVCATRFDSGQIYAILHFRIKLIAMLQELDEPAVSPAQIDAAQSDINMGR